jgi:prepilin-type N-terminal cleavage/methylation domain-containing protein
MRKGFSLVEVSIVILVLGLLSVIVFRGGILIHTSEVRSEIGKINKNATAVSLYYSELNALPDNISSNAATLGLMDVQDILNQQFITEFDLESKFSTEKWAYYHGITPDDNLSDGSIPPNKPFTVDNTTRIVGLSIEKIELRFLCSFERIVDDMNFLNGNGRYYENKQPTGDFSAAAFLQNNREKFKECHKIKRNGAVDGAIRYVYIIFAY